MLLTDSSTILSVKGHPMKFNRRFAGIATATALATSALVAPNAVADETPAADTNQSSISTGSDLSSKLGSSLDAGAQLSSGDKSTEGESTNDKDTEGETALSSKEGIKEVLAGMFRDEDGNLDPAKITTWIGVITSLISGLSAVISTLGLNK